MTRGFNVGKAFEDLKRWTAKYGADDFLEKEGIKAGNPFSEDGICDAEAFWLLNNGLLGKIADAALYHGDLQALRFARDWMIRFWRFYPSLPGKSEQAADIERYIAECRRKWADWDAEAALEADRNAAAALKQAGRLN